MPSTSLTQRLAVCSWSLQPTKPAELFANLEAIGIRRVQLALDPMREQPEIWGDFASQCAARGVQIVSGMFGTVGEDYTTMESIKRTGGIVPDATWEQNQKNIRATATLAKQLHLKLVTFHAGFLPHDPNDPAFAKIFERISLVADCFAEEGIDLAFETGQESADTLKQFLTELGRPNVGVNFDPANMILYDKGDPIAALRTLAPWLQQCHLKDARKTKVPGQWGEEVAVGVGEVEWRGFFHALSDIKFAGDLCIEREAGAQRVIDIRAARDFVANLRVY